MKKQPNDAEKQTKDREKQARDLEELEKISEDLWHEISLLPTYPRMRFKAEKKFSEFKRTHSVKAPEEYVRDLRKLITELKQIRKECAEYKVKKLKVALKKPLPDQRGEARPARSFFPNRPLPDRILLLLEAHKETRKHVTDIAIARMLKGGLEVEDVRRELLTLRDSGLIHMRKVKVIDKPAYGAMLTLMGLAKAAWLKIYRKTTIH
jgi:hypothetical protein